MPLFAEAWLGFTFRRGSDWCTVTVVGTAEAAATCVNWTGGVLVQVTPQDIHRSWGIQQRGVTHCGCEECCPERPAGARPDWQRVANRRQLQMPAAVRNLRRQTEREAERRAHRARLTPGTRVLAEWRGLGGPPGWYACEVDGEGDVLSVPLRYRDGDVDESHPAQFETAGQSRCPRPHGRVQQLRGWR
jgi:hypothetical protein